MKEGKKEREEGVSQPGFEPGMYGFARMWITTRPLAQQLMTTVTQERRGLAKMARAKRQIVMIFLDKRNQGSFGGRPALGL